MPHITIARNSFARHYSGLMPTPSDISHETIAQHLAQAYRLRVAQAELLPASASATSAAFRVIAGDETRCFLKLQQGAIDPAALALCAFLHHDKGIDAVMAPMPATDGTLSTQGHGFNWTLYPFFDGQSGFDRTLSDRQWIALGQALGAIHRTQLPEALLAKLPKESYAHQWREGVRRYQRRFINGTAGDGIVQRFLAFWEEHAEEIDTVVYRSEQLASILLERPPRLVPCHSDIHAGNVIVGEGDRLSIVGWHAPILAPKERDLMFIGGGVGNAWNQARQQALFYEGYGAADIDAVALAYYRYERITRDVLELCDRILDSAKANASAEGREEGMRLMQSLFVPNGAVAIAHQSYDAVT